MLYYSFISDYPHQDVDSVFILTDTELLCSYRFLSSSHDLGNFLHDAEQRGCRPMHRYDAYEVIQKQDALKRYQESKKILDSLLKASRKEKLQLAYRAARNNYIEAVRALDNSSPCLDVVTILLRQKEEAEAIFQTVRRVFEEEYLLDQNLPRGFDGLTEETINAMYKQECKGEKKDEEI